MDDASHQLRHNALMNDAMPLSGKTALITGAARRIGAALAEALHRDGASVLIHYRSSEAEAEALVERLNQRRAASARAARLDLLELERLGELVDAARSAFGGLDILINNASAFYPTPLGGIEPEQWRELSGSNLAAPLFLTQAAAPALKAGGGCVINMLDIHALRPLREHAAYTAAKAGLVSLTRSLALELAPEIRVNGIAPGAILWPEHADGGDPSAIVERIPLKRSGEPGDIVDAARYLISAPYVTGQVIAVDGGRSQVP